MLLTAAILVIGFGLLGGACWRLMRQRRELWLHRRALAATGCSVVITDARVPRHPVIAANPAFRLLTGYAEEEVVGQSLSLLHGPQTDRAVIEKLALAMQDGRPCRVLARHYRKGGVPFWNEISLTPIKNRTGTVVRYLWVMNDVTQRQQAEDALNHHQEPWRMLAEHSRDGLLVATESIIVYANRAAADSLGAADSLQLLGRPLVAFLHTGSFPVVRQIMEARQSSVTVPPTRGQMVRIDGRLVDARLSACSVLWQGKPSCALLLVPMNEEATTEEREAQFRLAMESSPSGMLLVGPDGAITMVNAQIERMFGYTRDELLGRPVECMLPERDHEGHEQHRQAFLAAPASRPMGGGRDLYGRRKDGSEFPLEIGLNPIRLTSGTAVLASVIDITARRQAEQALRDSAERLELAVQAAGIGIFEHDHETDHLYWSPMLRAMYGVRDDAEGSLQRYLDLVHPDDRETVLSAIRRAHDPAGDGRFDIEHRVVRPDTGDIRHIGVRCRTRFVGEGAARRPFRTIGAVVDMTLHKAAESSLRHASKMEAIGTLAGGIAHEFNNSLTAVLGFSELALGLIPADSKAHRHIQQVVAAGRKSRELVHQLLTFSQRGDPVRRPLSLHSLLKESLKLLRPSIPSWVELQSHIAVSTRPIAANAAQMHQLILNLVDNALHAMRQTGGVLGITLEDKELSSDLTTPHGILAAGWYVCLTVNDSGEGLEPEVAARMFDPFFTAKPIGQGRGMGLSAVHGIVAAHGGTIVVESPPAGGTTVTCYFPAVPPRASGPPPDEALPRGHECILFVDDEESLARFGGEMLESLGYYPVVRMTAADAWQAFKTAPQRFDLLMTDRAMPGMSGELLAEECQRLRPDLPVILCSGTEQISTPTTTRRIHHSQYLLKPIMLRDLAQAIRRALDSRPLAAAAPAGREETAFLLEDEDAVSTRR